MSRVRGDRRSTASAARSRFTRGVVAHQTARSAHTVSRIGSVGVALMAAAQVDAAPYSGNVGQAVPEWPQRRASVTQAHGVRKVRS